MLEFTSKELNKIQIFKQELDPANFDHRGLPTDIHLVAYVVNGKTLYDAVRGYTKADIFDCYYDKLKPIHGKLIDIKSGYGNVRPNLYGKIKLGGEEE
jgi:hypothetical protein